MPEKISIVKESGETISSNIVSVFMIPDTGKQYIITTENAVDPHGLTVLHVSEIVDGNLQKVATDDEWSSIKTIMRAIISGNVVSYQYLPPVESVKASSQYSRDISVSASAAKQMVDNYNAADKNASISSPEQVVTDSSVVSDSSNGVTNETPVVDNVVPENPVVPEAPTPDINSIFPTNATQEGGEEVIPGISEVSGVAPAVDVVQSGNLNTAIPSTGIVSPVETANVNPEMTIDLNTGMIQRTDNTSIPTMIPSDNMQNGMQNNVGMGINNDVQVVDPSQIVPTGQIVQDVTSQMNGFNGSSMGVIPNNVNPSFNPNASLDEVVVAAQEMFMEGVKNLVETIQEKVYRDLYAKEAALKAREELVLQREQMLSVNSGMIAFNPGMMGMNQGLMNSNMMQNVGVPMQQISGMPQNSQMFVQQPNMMMQQPMNGMQSTMGGMMQTQMQNGPVTVSAANDVV